MLDHFIPDISQGSNGGIQVVKNNFAVGDVVVGGQLCLNHFGYEVREVVCCKMFGVCRHVVYVSAVRFLTQTKLVVLRPVLTQDVRY